MMHLVLSIKEIKFNQRRYSNEFTLIYSSCNGMLLVFVFSLGKIFVSHHPSPQGLITNLAPCKHCGFLPHSNPFKEGSTHPSFFHPSKCCKHHGIMKRFCITLTVFETQELQLNVRLISLH